MFFTRSKRKKETIAKGNSQSSLNRPSNEVHLLVPIQDDDQGTLAISVLKNSHDDRVKSIRLFHCVEDRLANGGFVSAVDIIQTSDNQNEKLENSILKLQQLAHRLSEDLPGVRVTVKSRLHPSVSGSIVDEANLIDATMILFVQDPKRKRHWLIPGISNRVLRTASTPVQIIKPSRDQQDRAQLFVA
ncbi:MAG: universal stress protein [Candidatus Melainabacteria bacterium]|nr:universal stress protein [Candidatus Melainabacteria bacterium]